MNEEGQQSLVLGEAPVQIKAEATDGEGSVESSGIASLAIEVDEHRIGIAEGECFPGPCTATGEWTLDGSELGVGMHTLTVVATDYAGNIGKREYPLEVYPASPVALGPGSVNPESGDFALGADDVDMSGGLGGLSVTRHYDSLNTNEGAEGPLGPQWTLNLGSLASLEELPDGSIMVVGPEGLAHFAKTESGFEAPPGDQNLTLEFKQQGSQGQPEYLLRDPSKGTTIRFTKPIGAESWMPTVSEGPVATNATTDAYTTVEPEEGKTIVEPTLELAPHPDAECARGKMERGCRALEFIYGEATTATQGEWGEYKHRLMGIKFIAWDPATEKMREVEVAKYLYDDQGRLRAEWNPTIEPALKTTYGYDEESHVTAVSSPGQEPWLIHYGTTAGDPSLGRVVAVSRPHASASLGSVASPTNEAIPSLSSKEPGPDMTIKATTGSWSGNPLDFGYQWYDCAGKCVPIEGAIDNTYVPKATDAGQRLMVRVSATNAAGTTAATSRESEPLPERARPQFDVDGKVASTSYGIKYESHSLPLELYFFSHGAAIEDLTCRRVYGIGSIGTEGEGVVSLQLSECSIGSKEGCSIPTRIETGPLSVVLAYEDGEEGVASPQSVLAINPTFPGRFMTLRLMNCAQAGSFEVTGSLVLKLEAAEAEAHAHGAQTLETPPGFELNGRSYPDEVVVQGLNTRGRWLDRIPFPTWSLSVGESHTWSAAPGAYLNYPSGEAPETPESSGLAVATVEYGVSVSGKDAPYELGKSEVAKWAQKDDPVYATAIFPPEETEPWPASGEYKRATIYYMDAEGRTVNVATPGDAVATTEYDASDDVVRSLSPQNRARTLEAGAESAAVSERLDTTSVYGHEETELEETLGPEHEVKLEDGETVMARNHVRYFYDEGAPEGEAGEPEEYGLVTKTADGAWLADGEEKDVRTTLTGYSGQEGLGWRLRVPTSTTVDPRGLDLVSETLYDEATGNVVESRSPGGTAETVSPLEPTFSFGSEGTGGGQFDYPQAAAVAGDGDIWVADKGKSRLEVFSGSGGFIAAYGAAGSGEGQFDEPCGIAINRTSGDVYVADTQNDRVQELDAEGKFLRSWGTEGSGAGDFDAPAGITVDGAGHVWVSDYGDDRVQEFSETGSFIRQFGSKGSGDGQFEHARALAFSQGMLYVVDEGNKRVQEFTITGSYAGQFGSGELESPWGIAVAPVTGDLYVSDEAGNDLLEFSPAGKLLTSFGYWGSGVGKLEGPTGLAVSAAGELFVAEQNNDRISAWRPAEAGAVHLRYSTQFGTSGSGGGQFEWPLGAAVDSSGNVWVSDNHSGRVEKFSAQGRYLAEYGSEGSEEKQLDGPAGVAINQATGDIYIADCGNHRIQERNGNGEVLRNFTSEHLACPDGIAVDSAGDVWVSDSSADEIEQFSATGAFLHAYGSEGTGDLQFKGPAAITFADEKLYVLDTHNNRVQELSLAGEYLAQFGTEGSGGGQFEDPEGIAADAAGDLFVSDSRNNRIEEFSANGKYLQSISSHGEEDGQLSTPQGLAITAAGSIYVADGNNHRVQKWAPNNQAVHDTKTIYYSAGANSAYPTCGEHPEWVALPCESLPDAQPEGEGLPRLPVTRIEYNIYDQPEKTIEDFGSTTRTKSTTFEESGRPVSASVTAGVDKPVATVTDKYDSETGALVEQSTDGEDGPETISRSFNTLGQLTTYTDGDGNTTSYSYDEYGRLSEVNYDVTGLDGMTATQQYTYDETTGELSELEDSAAGAFKASYNIEGNLASEIYPNGMLACYDYNSIGEAISLKYVKGTGCGSEGGSVWFSQSVAPSVHGEWLSQKSSLANTSYAYDPVGRLTEVQEEPTGEGCTTRLYSYNLEGDRTSQTTREPGSEGKCAASGGETLRHTYDEADRLDDEGVAYEELGNITSLPEADANGGKLTSEYYVDGQVRTQDQGGTLNTYMLDPDGRAIEAVTVKEGAGSQTVISHYAGPGSTPSWTYNQTTEAWTRNVTGIGGVVALQEAGKEAVLQMSDLEGNIVGTASLSEEATEPLSMERSTEFGVPVSKEPTDKLGWLGASGVSPQLPSGAIVQDGATYVPLIGMPLQTEGIAPPIPANKATPYVSTFEPWNGAVAAEAAAQEAASYQDTLSKIEKAEMPGGNAPMPGKGAREAIGGSSGESNGGATIASRPLCEVRWKMDEIEQGSNEMWLSGGFLCKHSVPSFELQLCMFVEYPKQTKFNSVYCIGPHEHGVVLSHTHGEEAIMWHSCITGLIYTGWVWGRVFSGKETTSVYGGKSVYKNPTMVCEGSGVEAFIEEWDFLKKG